MNYDLRKQFNVGTPSHGRVLKILEDSNKNIWATTVGLNVLKFNRENDIWEKTKFILKDSTKLFNSEPIAYPIAENTNNKIWIGSFQNGLMWYDENKGGFVEEEIISENNVLDFTEEDNLLTDLYFDTAGILWITTKNGVFKYNPSSKKLKTIIKNSEYALSFWTYFSEIAQDKNGNIWIANNYRGILKFDGISDHYEIIKPTGGADLSDIVMLRLFVDNTGIMWFGTLTQGVLKHDPERELFNHYQHDEKNKNSVSGNQIFGIIESKYRPGKLFVGTRGAELNLFDPANQSFSKISYQLKSSKDQFGGSVRSIYEEEDGSLWLGTWGDGLIKMDNNFNVTKQYIYKDEVSEEFTRNQVRILKKNSEGNLWIGTGNGVNYHNPVTKRNKWITNRETAAYPDELINIVNGNIIKKSSIAEIAEVGNSQDLSREFNIVKPREFLIVSVGEGRIIDSTMIDYGWLADKNGKIIWTSINNKENYHLGGDKKNRINVDLIKITPGKYYLKYRSDESHSFDNWNGEPPEYEHLWGIRIFEIEDVSELENIKRQLKETKNQLYIKGRNIRSIHISRNDVIWIGSDTEGLNKYDKGRHKVKTYAHEQGNPNSISNNSVQYIYEDNNGILWLATNGGLNRFDPIKEEFSAYTEEDGLPTNYIASILPGESDDLWLATRAGISRVVKDKSTSKVTFVNYDNEDGLGGTDFIAQVAFKSSNGKYYFGGEHGLNEFVPSGENVTSPSLIFSDLKISNESVLKMTEESPLKNSLYESESLILPFDQNDISFEYAALHYSNPQKNQYAHKLEGYDQDWIYDNSRIATYTNLNPGEYNFVFKGSNRDGLWNDKGKSLQVTILPPWWFTTWAYIGYGLIFVGIIFGIDRIQRRRIFKRAKEKLRIQNIEHRAEAAELQAKVTESEKRALEAEYEMKKKELEEARELQLSMLPKELPQLPHLDIAVYMKTATEVGGDYYDFHIGLDGTLTVVLGDATGHGMKAGTMVTSTKSLFNVLAPNPNIVETFHEMTRCLKQMQLEKLSMCMTMIKIIGNKVQMSAAGMPPIFICKREDQTIEEHVMKGMPLGTFRDFPYTLVETNINSGDTILLMSDGFPELMNDKKEIFGYKQTRNLFEEVSGESPEAIITKLKDVGSEWIKDKNPDDDVTFVVIKVK
ncbi:MAG: SpoIIE family protein phosphatase [Bacteroidota bacterium]